MIFLNYKRLLSVAHSVPPYRGTTNRFPTANRRDNNKYFLMGEEDGEKIFNIVYGDRYVRKDITKEEHDEYLAQGKAAGHSSASDVYYTWEKAPNFMGIVRPDNSYEFTGSTYAQGEHYFLSKCSQGWFNTDSRRGGMLYRPKAGNRTKMYPIYRGMKMDCETMLPLEEDIVITGRKVYRKAGKDLLKRYEDFYKICEVMCKNMNSETFEETATSIYNEYKPIEGGWDWMKDTEMAFALADSLIHQAPFDALIMYALALDVYGMRWTVRHGAVHAVVNTVPMNAFEATKRKLNKYLYTQNENVFNPMQYAMGDYLPASEWGYTITVGGEEVEQY